MPVNTLYRFHIFEIRHEERLKLLAVDAFACKCLDIVPHKFFKWLLAPYNLHFQPKLQNESQSDIHLPTEEWIVL